MNAKSHENMSASYLCSASALKPSAVTHVTNDKTKRKEINVNSSVFNLTLKTVVFENFIHFCIFPTCYK